MTQHIPKFLLVHFDGDYLEHAGFVNSEEEASQMTCRVIPGDHWSPVLIPIETAAAAPDLFKTLNQIVNEMQSASSQDATIGHEWLDKRIKRGRAAIAKAKPK